MTINTLFQILFLNYFLGCWSRIWFDLLHGDSRVWRHWSPWSDCWREKRYCEWLNHYSPFSEFNALYYSGHRWEQAGLHQAGLSNEDDWSDQEAVICLPWGILWHYSQKVNTIFRLNLLTKISNLRLIAIFNEQELELLLSGLPDINIDDLKANTEYHKYTATSLQIVW